MPATSLSNLITDALCGEILRGQYREGERLPSERDLSERFDAHRGAVREALKRLEQLGLADIRPGGARVAPIEDASLDVVEHLLHLEDPPSPQLIDQVLEVFAGFFGMGARLAVQRGSDAELEAALVPLRRLQTPRLDPEEQRELMHAVGRALVAASGNLVLRLVANGLRTHFIRGTDDRDSSIILHATESDRITHAAGLERALLARDLEAVTRASHELITSIRRNAPNILTNTRQEQNGSALPGTATSLAAGAK